ncbi:MAG: cupredoxin family copper-binding protein [Proteobacteria bacterium]|nr:cupredoxin family copper-binding protein [Pseudomonadota bacterium]
MSARWVGALLACAIALPRMAAGAGQTAAAATHVVRVENMQFTPSSLTVRRGDRIVWVNKDLFPHTVTSDTKAFDSHDIPPSASWTYRADRPGEYAYSCAYHPTMKAKIIVR